MPWQVLILFYVFGSSFRSILGRIVGKNNYDLTYYALVSSFTAVAFVGTLFILLSDATINHNAAQENWYRFALGGLGFALINILTLKMLRLVPASIAVFLKLLATVSIVFVASIFTQERLTLVQWAGFIFLAASIVTVMLVKKSKGDKSNSKIRGLVIAMLVAAISGPVVVNEAYLISKINIETYLLYGWGLQVLAAYVLALTLRQKDKKLIAKRVHFTVWLYGALLGISGISFVSSVRESQSASLSSISTIASVAFTIMLAHIFLHERENLALKVCSGILAGIGLVLLFS